MNSDDDTIVEIDEKLVKYKRDKALSIKPLFEILYKEKELIISQQDNFQNLLEDNLNLQKLIDVCKDDILKMSIVHGQKKAEEMLDENASQNNHSGFNADLVKKIELKKLEQIY